MPPSNVVCPAFLFLTIEVCWTLKIGKSREVKFWQVENCQTYSAPYIRFISDSLFDLRATDLSVLSVNIWCQTTFWIFRTFCKPCNRNVCWTFCKLVSLVKSNFGRYNHQTILLLYSTRQNVISRGLPIFGSFCKLLRNVVTEIFAEAAANC